MQSIFGSCSFCPIQSTKIILVITIVQAFGFLVEIVVHSWCARSFKIGSFFGGISVIQWWKTAKHNEWPTSILDCGDGILLVISLAIHMPNITLVQTVPVWFYQSGKLFPKVLQSATVSLATINVLESFTCPRLFRIK